MIRERELEAENDDKVIDPSEMAFDRWLASKFINYRKMDKYTRDAFLLYWIKNKDEGELTEEEEEEDKDCHDDLCDDV